MDTVAEETASTVAKDEDEEEKDSSCPVSEDRREQERRSTVCRELQRRSSGRHCSVTLTHPETHTHTAWTGTLGRGREGTGRGAHPPGSGRPGCL